MQRRELTARRRVKLYLLNEENEWDDGGTGYVAVVSAPMSPSELSLLVNSETDSSALLDAKIDTEIMYQKQQDTLIVWFDHEAQNNLALSFQEAAGCDEIWAKICHVHGKPPHVKTTSDDANDIGGRDAQNSDRASMSMRGGSLANFPPCDLAHLDELLMLIRESSRFPNRRDRLGNTLESGNYVQKLGHLFHLAEDLESTEILGKLFEITKLLFHLNRTSLLETMMIDENIMDVVGMLEYDPTLKERPEHRKFLSQRARFREVLPIGNADLVRKIERTFRMQYILDIVQPMPLTILDTDATVLSALTSQIYFNKVEIVLSIQNDRHFLNRLFRQMTGNSQFSTDSGSDHEDAGCEPVTESSSGMTETSSCNGSSTEDVSRSDNNGSNKQLVVADAHRLELVMLLRELCNYALTLQPEQRAEFLKRLSEYKICAVLELLLASDVPDIRQTAIDIFSSVVEFSPPMVRDFVLHEGEVASTLSSGTNDTAPPSHIPGPEEGLLPLVIAELLNDSDPELGSASHVANLLRLLLDPENMITASNNRMEKVDFLSHFYKNCMHALVAPLLAITADLKKPSRDDYHTALQTQLIIELLTFCLEMHGPHIRRYIIARDLTRRALVLLRSKHMTLVLAALRFFRRMIGLKDIGYVEHIMENHLFDPVVEVMLTNQRDNMLRSALHELFQFVRTECMDELVLYIVDRFADQLPPSAGIPDPLGTFTWMRDHARQLRSQPASLRRSLTPGANGGNGNGPMVGPTKPTTLNYQQQQMQFGVSSPNSITVRPLFGNAGRSHGGDIGVSSSSSLLAMSPTTAMSMGQQTSQPRRRHRAISSSSAGEWDDFSTAIDEDEDVRWLEMDDQPNGSAPQQDLQRQNATVEPTKQRQPQDDAEVEATLDRLAEIRRQKRVHVADEDDEGLTGMKFAPSVLLRRSQATISLSTSSSTVTNLGGVSTASAITSGLTISINIGASRSRESSPGLSTSPQGNNIPAAASPTVVNVASPTAAPTVTVGNASKSRLVDYEGSDSSSSDDEDSEVGKDKTDQATSGDVTGATSTPPKSSHRKSHGSSKKHSPAREQRLSSAGENPEIPSDTTKS